MKSKIKRIGIKVSRKARRDPPKGRHVRARKSVTETREMISEVTRARIGAANRAGWADPNVRTRRIEAIARPEVRAKKAEATRKSWNNPDIRASRTAGMRRFWQRPGVRQRMSEAQKAASARPEVFARRSAAQKQANSRAEVRALKSAAIKKSNERPDIRARKSASARKACENPSERARRTAVLMKQLADPEVKARQLAGIQRSLADPEVRRRRGAAIRKAFSDPEVKARLRAGRIKAAQRLLASRGGGRPPIKTEIWRQGAKLRENGASWPTIARRLTPTAFSEDFRKAAESIRLGVTRWKKSHFTG